MIKTVEHLWYEKYRPKTFDDIIGSVETISKIKKYLVNPMSMPHFLLYSKSPGTGKTTIGKAIIKTLSADSLIMNASDERKIEDIRNKVKTFVTRMSVKDVPKIVFLDEIDGMIRGSQEALRSIIETYSKGTRFILTCNRIHKVIPPLQDRCMRFNLRLPPKDKILLRLKFICESEKVMYEEEALNKIIEIFYPSIRNMINEMQKYGIDGKILLKDIKKEEELELEVYNFVKQKKFLSARRIWIENNLNLGLLLTSFFDFMMKDNEIQVIQKKNLVELIAETDFRMKLSQETDIQFSAFVLKTIRMI